VVSLFIAPDPFAISLESRLLPPLSDPFVLGSDQLGRCVLARLLAGGRVTVASAFAVLLSTLVVGSLLGCLAGYLGGSLDRILTKLTDGVMAFPGLILALVLVGVMGPGLASVLIALTAVHWVGYFRTVRNLVKNLRERAYVEAARISGAGFPAIIRQHILPKTLPFVAIYSSLQFGRVILSLSALSFLGLGVQPPAPEWGAMLREAKPYLQTAPHLFLFPGLAIALAVAGLQMMGMGLQQKTIASERGYH
jgi:ABC-type dipeptide/oligopeptide/nickel transport system permease subunit